MIRMLLFLLLLPRAVWADNVTVFAAASLKTALEEIATEFETASGHSVTLSFAGSSALARQIGFGAPADVFISANTAWMDHVENQGLIDPESRVSIAGNQLVLIGSTASEWVPGSGLPAGRIATGLLEAVPVGIYAKQALTNLDLLQDALPNVVQTDNARAALALVALGEAPLGIVYRSDAIAETAVHVLGTFPKDSHAPIDYPASMVLPGSDAARAFLGYLVGDVAQAILAENGFAVPE